MSHPELKWHLVLPCTEVCTEHYYQSYQTVYRPGYKKVDTIARMETSLYTTADNKLIWAGKTESMNPDSRQKAIKEIAQTLTKDMKDRGILK